MKTNTIAVIIPAYKVEDHIEKVIKGIPDFVDLIVIVNDCSPDGTVDKVRSIKEPRVVLVSHKKNQGVGGAMLTGYSVAFSRGTQIMVKVDGDGQMDSSYISSLVKPILDGQVDYSKGNRFLHPTELRRMPAIRRIGNWGLTFLTKAASGYWNIFDPTNGFTAISANCFSFLDPSRISRDYFFETSMLCELRRQNAVVRDIAIPAIYNGEKSSLNVWRQLFSFPLNLCRKLFTRIYNQYFLFDFSAGSFFLLAGILLELFGLVWGIVKWVKSAQTGQLASTGTVLIAVLPVILGVQLLIQAIAWDINNVPQQDQNEMKKTIGQKAFITNKFQQYFIQLRENKEIEID